MESPLAPILAHPRLPVQLYRGCRPGELHLLALAVPITGDDCEDLGAWLAEHGRALTRAHLALAASE
ncbi:hypothetical protein DQ384_05285 [Sphaerisporangium album]|uniref:Uncharacterized protein n=1 Tax=Sphaerisporangium album TaxID=509200 RepID=A0A367FQG9_9ACTN|nr:hypothetical protein [Sphaerisporangium album]RCG31957.1 hypothetical protein DQ384_05285 [Sphaerisporangium album]